MTNADRIRAMTDEKLAKWLDGMITNCDNNDIPCRLFCYKTALSCRECWYEWLKQEVDDERTD